MPLSTPSVLVTSVSAVAADPFTTGSVSPTANALVLVLISTTTNAGSPNIVGVSSTLSGMGTWTEIADIAHTATTKALAAAYYSVAGASPGTGTITVDASSSFARWTVTVVEIASGYDTSTPAINAKTGTGTSATPSLTLDSSPAADSIVMGLITSLGDDGVTPGAAYAELVDATSGGSNAARQEIEYDASPGSTTVDWADAGTTSNAFLAFEIKAAGSGAQTVNAATGSLTIAGQSATVQPGAVTVSGAAGTLSLSGQSATVLPGAVTIDTQAATLTLAGQIASVVTGSVVDAVAGALALSGQQAAVTPGAVSINAQAGALAVAGQQATVQPGAIIVTCSAGALGLAGAQAAIVVSVEISAQAAALSVSGQSAAVQPGAVTITLAVAALILSGQNASISGGEEGRGDWEVRDFAKYEWTVTERAAYIWTLRHSSR